MKNAIVALMITSTASIGWAGRPLSTDDAGTAEEGTCQVEGWHARAGSERASVLGLGCGVVAGLEIGADYTLPRPRDTVRGVAGLAAKWAPASWQADTPLGELNFGVKLGVAFERAAGASWRSAQTGALALATLAPSENWALHANLGIARDRASGTNAGLLNLAVSWAPVDAALLFAETQANSRRAVFGPTVNSAGGRWWALKDRVGLDLTASREARSGADTAWTIGFGWYGLSL